MISTFIHLEYWVINHFQLFANLANIFAKLIPYILQRINTHFLHMIINEDNSKRRIETT